MTREQMISELSEQLTNSILECGAREWVENRLRFGMGSKPFCEMTDDELCDQYCAEFPIDGDGETDV